MDETNKRNKNKMSFAKKFLVFVLVLFLILNLTLIIFTTTAKNTALNPDFIEQEIKDLHMYSVAKEIVVDGFASESESEDDPFVKILNESITDEWMESQGHNFIYNFIAYLKHTDDEPNLMISTIEFKNNLRTNTRRILPENPEFQEQPPENQTEIFKFFDENFDEYITDDVNLMKMEEITGDKDSDSGELENLLGELRKIVDWFYIFSYLLIVIGVFSIISIAFILRNNIGSILDVIGTSLIISGVFSYGICIGIISLLSDQIKNIDMPPLLNEKIMMGVSDTLAVTESYALVILIIGLILLTSSFLYRQQKIKQLLDTIGK